MASDDDVHGRVFAELLDEFLDDRHGGRLLLAETAVLALRDLLIEHGLTTEHAFDLAVDARYQHVCREGLSLCSEQSRLERAEHLQDFVQELQRRGGLEQ